MIDSATYLFVVMVTCTSVVSKLVETVNTKGLHHHNQSKATMLTRSQKHEVLAGTTVLLDCEFTMDNYSAFDNPIIWEKQQYGEKTQINLQGSVHEPFAKTRRYDVNPRPTPAPRYRYPLKIQMAAAEDNGNYTCVVRGRNSVVLDKVMHSVHVKDYNPPEQITSSNELHRLVTLNLTEGQSVPIRCVSNGGHPAPVLSVAISDRDITSQFETTVHVTDPTGPRGLRTSHFRSSCWTPSFTVTSDDHGKVLRCIAHVEGVGNTTSNVSLLVSYAPKINCTTVEADIGDHVEIRCHVNARPSPLSLYWLIDSNNTVISTGDSDANIWTLNRDLGDTTLETILTIRQVSWTSFRVYTLLAENELGQTSREIRLVRTARPKTKLTTSAPDWSIREIVDLRSPFPDQSELRMSDSSSTVYIRLNGFRITIVLVASLVLRRAIQ